MHLLMALCLLSLAGSGPGCTRPGPDRHRAVSVERIRRGLESPPATVTVRSSIPTFPDLSSGGPRAAAPLRTPVDGDSSQRTSGRSEGSYHHEFLEQVTPEIFRGTCVSVLRVLPC